MVPCSRKGEGEEEQEEEEAQLAAEEGGKK